MISHASDKLMRGLLLLLATLVVAGQGCRARQDAADGEAQAAASKFLDALREGQYKAAWETSSTEFKSLMGVENLRDYIKTHPALKGSVEFVETRHLEGSPSLAECLFRGTTPKRRGKPTPATIKVLLAPNPDGWQVERLSVE